MYRSVCVRDSSLVHEDCGFETQFMKEMIKHVEECNKCGCTLDSTCDEHRTVFDRRLGE